MKEIPLPEGANFAGPFAVYEDYEGELSIIDGWQRVVLADGFAYDGTQEQRIARMQWIADALTQAFIPVCPHPHERRGRVVMDGTLSEHCHQCGARREVRIDGAEWRHA